MSEELTFKYSNTASTYPTEKVYIKQARKITQEYIENYGGGFGHIDELDNSIADEIEKETDALRKQLEVANKFIDDMIINDGTHSDISILADRAKAEIERIGGKNE